jgi:hypothetical protein
VPASHCKATRRKIAEASLLSSLHLRREIRLSTHIQHINVRPIKAKGVTKLKQISKAYRNTRKKLYPYPTDLSPHTTK